ncbi:hypothetical protein Ahy_A06g026037 [Arachis hypogaea]|uniref:PB1-like domain-containing protein n=1 Tax=Arachis hypogaea TaxID=3818 RepID=A0A445CJ70_ARAHY|nr:hypothetical protein Ahy_A06g026037 [Arachis hypogaea]
MSLIHRKAYHFIFHHCFPPKPLGKARTENPMSVFVILIFKHGGKLVRATNGKLCYLGGKVEKFPPMDVDFVNKKDLEELFKGLGYLAYKEIYWHDPTDIAFEDDLHVLHGGKEINNMCDFTMSHNLNEFHLYFEHAVDTPIVTEDNPVVEEIVFEDEHVLGVTDSSKSLSSLSIPMRVPKLKPTSLFLLGSYKAVKEVMSNAHHRNCMLHTDKQVKGCVWKAAKSTTPIQFKAAMDRLKMVSNGAWEYMSKFDPKVWCRAFVSHYPKNATVTNNMCKSWNAV